MAEYNKDKKYYWLKLQKDFFKRHDIRLIQSMPNGTEYVLFYLKLMVESLAHNGRLRFSEKIPYDESMLAVITDTNIDIVRNATRILEELGMLQVLDDSTIYMTEVKNLIGVQTEGAIKKQLQRQNRQELLEGGQKVENCPPEIELEKELDIEIDNRKRNIKEKDIFDKDDYSSDLDCLSGIPTLQEVRDYCILKSFTFDPNDFYDYYGARGWKLGGQPIENWQLLANQWGRRENLRNGLQSISQEQPQVIKPKIIEPQFEQRKYTDDDFAHIFNGSNDANNITDDDI